MGAGIIFMEDAPGTNTTVRSRGCFLFLLDTNRADPECKE